jgi:hypothetical protein
MLLISLGCSGDHPKYGVVVRNLTPNGITRAQVSYGQFRSIPASLQPGRFSRYGLVPEPIPDQATVEWDTSDGLHHKKEVAVKPLLPARFSGELIFRITEAGEVVVRGSTLGDELSDRGSP